MKQLRLITHMLMAVAIAFVMGACSSDELSDMHQEHHGKHTAKMEFVGSVVGFDQQGSSKAKVQTRATSTSWNDGDKIYLTFYNGSNVVPGEATYSSASGWSVSYDGDLATGSNLKCEARYFVNATFTSSSYISLNSNTEIYEDLNGVYTYNDDVLIVKATLFPKTGRIRFTGESNEKIHVTGITVYSAFSPVSNTYSTSDFMITTTVASNGSTPYIYGFFTSENGRIGIVESDNAFTRTCGNEIFNVGESGYMAIPSETSHNNWRSGLYVTASGVEFKMIPVAGLESGFFLMAETETTEALYKSVNGASSKSQLPIDNISYKSILSFIEKLNDETQLNFSLPSAKQWEYAAVGGKKTLKYKYAGSNTPGDVAWYADNCTTKQNVKTKFPNELGLYDMSGNVGEFVSTLYDYYNNGIGYPYIYGGGYCSDASYITNN